MRFGLFTAAAIAAIAVAGSAFAGAVTVSVDGQAGPWDQGANPSLDYGVHDNLGPTVVNVTAGDNLTISYVSGLTSAFGGVPPTVDADGYMGAIFGSGACCTGIGSSGTPFPSFYIDPTNSGPQIALNELIGAFANGSTVLSFFAVGNGPLNVIAPVGANHLLLGLNDDIFADNSGSLSIQVSGLSPEPGAWALMLLGFGALGAALRSRRGRAIPA